MVKKPKSFRENFYSPNQTQLLSCFWPCLDIVDTLLVVDRDASTKPTALGMRPPAVPMQKKKPCSIRAFGWVGRESSELIVLISSRLISIIVGLQFYSSGPAVVHAQPLQTRCSIDQLANLRVVSHYSIISPAGTYSHVVGPAYHLSAAALIPFQYIYRRIIHAYISEQIKNERAAAKQCKIDQVG